MRHISVLAAGLMTTTILTGLCAFGQTEESSNDQPRVSEATASPAAQTPTAAPESQDQKSQDQEPQDQASAGALAQSDSTARPGDKAGSDEQTGKTMQTGLTDSNGNSANTPSETAGTNPAAENNAQNSTGTASNKPEAAEQKTADQDFGHLSQDGSSAFDDIHMARVAIFDGNIEEAAKLVSDAQDALNRASTDNTSFLKAESALSERADMHARSAHKNANQIVWLPIDGQIVVGENYKPTTDKAAAVVNARKNLQKGQAEQAMKSIRVAAIDVDYTMALAPLQQSIADVRMADKFMTDHDYYAASQALKQAEDGVRYDEIDDVAHVNGNGGNAANNTSKNNG